MTVERHELQNELDYTRNLQEKCKKYMYYHVTLTMRDGSSFDGIIEDVDRDHVTVLVGEDVMERENDESDDRQYDGYGRPRRRRFRRFRRQILPLALLAALSLLPYSYPYPYPYYSPYYPYY